MASLQNDLNHVANFANSVKNMHKLSDLQKNAIIPADVKNAVSQVVHSVNRVKHDVSSLVKEIMTRKLVADAVQGSGYLIEAVTTAPKKLLTSLLEKVNPTNAYSLVSMLKVHDLNAKCMSGADALGASAPSILHPDNAQALRLLIREALGVESKETAEHEESVSEHHGRLARSMEAALGGDDDEGACFFLDIPIFDDCKTTK